MEDCRVSRRITLLGLFIVLTAGVAAAWWAWRSSPPPAARPARRRADWDVPRLVEHLRSRGLDLHVRPTSRDGPAVGSVYLTETERPWRELTLLRAAREHVGEWRGVVLCERNDSPDGDETRLATWGDGCLDLPPFVFFGDPALRARIEAALRDDDP